MKKYLIIFLLLVIIIVAVWLLQLYGVISLRAWGEKIITRTPFLREYVRTNQAYQTLVADCQQWQAENDRLKNDNQRMGKEITRLSEQVSLQQAKIEELEGELAVVKAEQEDNQAKLDKLVKIYTAMEAADAANIILSLDNDLALKLLQNLKEDKTAAILSTISPEQAAEFSRALQ